MPTVKTEAENETKRTRICKERNEKEIKKESRKDEKWDDRIIISSCRRNGMFCRRLIYAWQSINTKVTEGRVFQVDSQSAKLRAERKAGLSIRRSLLRTFRTRPTAKIIKLALIGAASAWHFQFHCFVSVVFKTLLVLLHSLSSIDRGLAGQTMKAKERSGVSDQNFDTWGRRREFEAAIRKRAALVDS